MNITDRIYATLGDIIGLSLFSSLKEHPLLGALREVLDDLSEERNEDLMYGIPDTYLEIVEDWAAFITAFVQTQRDYSFYITLGHLTLGDDNPYTRAAENQENPPAILCSLAKTDLSRLGRIASFEIHSLGFHIAEILRKNGLDQIAGNIEEESRVLWAAEGKKSRGEYSDLILKLFPENANWGAALPAVTEHLRIKGAGILGQYDFFIWASASIFSDFSRPHAPVDFAPGGGGARPLSLFLLPVRNPDPVAIADFYGYEDQRSVVAANTIRFLEGRNANNLLLYGDRGTGKSATIKAVCNEYSGRGLKLIEINKSDLAEFSEVLETLASRRSRRFIVFIDDLSFESADDSFMNIKAMLEGGLESRPPNVVIYATSNRRHLVKEQLADRPTTAQAAESVSTGDVRAFDTMQEQFSLADRFGVTVVFTTPGQEEYLRIAEHIARRRGVLPDPLPALGGECRTRFRENALRWEKWFNGRSPRTAVQYVDWLAGEKSGASGPRFPWE
ncbi:MAG: ATP-binding protein [Spirochaetaceae bacterium]|jgi:predicted AAA+ superfamily ATPase|nr:ATP-binding protein [Spirochaetaceae bacterium]